MWFITVFEKCEVNEYGWPDFGDQRTWGYYSEYEDALRALHENRTDMWESFYDYAVLERLDEGICPSCDRVIWFKYNRERDGYFETLMPCRYDHLGNFALG